MKYFIALSAVILAASALPTDIGYQAPNITFSNAGLMGFGAASIGGRGGAVWTVWDPWALRDAINTVAPRIIHVRGRIDMTRLFTGSPGVGIHCGPYKTLLGGDGNAEIFGGGLRLQNQRHVIIQNIKFTNALSYAPGEQPNGNGGIVSQRPGAFSEIDNLDITNSHTLWIDHCEFSDDPWNAATTPGDRRRHDGLIDIRRGSNMISISNSIFRNHNMVSLVGNSDNAGATDDGKLKTTWYLNWFRGTIQRNPRVRFGEVHILNNLYTDIPSYAIGIGVSARVYGERNVFINTPRAWVWASAYGPVPNPIGNFRNDNNRLVNSNFDSSIPPNIGFLPNQYYRYTPMDVSNVEAHVRRHAGTR